MRTASQITRRFQRSIRIDTDLGDARALNGFVCPRSSAEVLLTMARHVHEVGHAASLGPARPGTGKSSLAIALCSLLHGSVRVRKEAARIVGEDVSKSVWKALPPRAEGWSILPVVARRGDPATVIGEAIVARSAKRGRPIQRWSMERVIGHLTAIAGTERAKRGGLILIIDEMGKFLESAVQDGVDIYASSS